LTVAFSETVEDVGVRLEGAEVLGGSTGLNVRGAGPDGPLVVRIHRRHVSAQRVEAMQLTPEAAGSAGIPIADPVLERGGTRIAIVDGCVVEIERS
jgi:hypothetical protein